MFITDSQIHLFLPDTPDHPWPAETRGLAHGQLQYLPEDILPQMDGASVQRAVLVPPSWSGDDNGPCLSWAAQYPGRFAVMGRFDLLNPDRGRIETWLQQPHMLGVRFAGALHRGEWLDLEQFGWFWEAIERLRIPVMLLAAGERIGLVKKMLERHPDAIVIMDHFGTTIGDLNEIDPWAHQDHVLELAKFPHVYGKLSALPLNTLEAYPFPSQTKFIRKAYDVFGPKRLAWGTDASRFRRSTYRQAVDHMLHTIDFLTEGDKEWIMSRTIASVLNWPAADGRSS
ncbi:amidohydrolase family protein [Rhizobium jaguaris]|uniref:amidohydrolase family protein n=1 Tax=Rhizobium jaguaris TaxID=1312183 RepID=UPI0039BFFA9B